MIIQCEQCQTKFRLDDSKVKDTGAKVRCARCKHVFAVSKEQQESVPPTGFGAILDQNAAFAGDALSFDPFAHHEEISVVESEQEHDFDSSSYDVEEREEGTVTIDPNLFDLPEEEPPPVDAVAPDFSEYDPEEDQIPEQSAAEPASSASELDFGGFDFGDVPEYAENSAQDSSALPGLGATSPDSSAPLDFNLQFSDFADSAPGQETADTGENASATAVDEPFRLGEIDFGDDLSSLSTQQVNPDDSRGGLDFDFGHLDEPQEAPATFASSLSAPWVAPVQAPVEEVRPSTELTSDKIGMWGPWSLAAPEPEGSSLAGLAAREKLSPLAIPEQYKQSHLTTLLFATIAFFGMVYGIYSGNTRAREEAAIPAQTSQASLPTQTGQAAGAVVLSSVDAAFVNNKKAGELLVITGSAVNNFQTARAAIQIKGMVYGDSGQVVASKTAYCGNLLTREQLASMPLDTIEAAMVNQIGSALDNLEVVPGKSIPCMVVISKLPEDSKDYGAVVAGSLPATGKQKKPQQSGE